MPPPYSTDLRERVLVAYEHGEGTAAALARRILGGAQYSEKLGAGGRERGAARGQAPWAAGHNRVWARQSARCCANWWRLTIMPLWPNIARGWRRRPGTTSAGQCSRLPSSAWA